MGSTASCLNANHSISGRTIHSTSSSLLNSSTPGKNYQVSGLPDGSIIQKESDVKALRDIGNSGSTIASGHKGDSDSGRETVKLSGGMGSNHSSQSRGCPEENITLYEDDLLDKADFLSRNAWDRQVFIRYILGDLWRGRVSPQLRKELAISAQWLKTTTPVTGSVSTGVAPLVPSPISSTTSTPNKRPSQYKDEVDEVSSNINFTIEDLQQIMPMSHCQALLIGSVLYSFFVFRREVDFNVVLEENAPTLPSSIKCLTVDDDSHIVQDHLYEENGQFFLDPEHILSIIAMSSTSEDLDKLLMNCFWMQHFSAALDNLQISLKVIELPKLSKGNSDDTCDSHSMQSISYAMDPLLIFDNPSHQRFAGSLSRDSLLKIQAKNAISELKATKGYVVLDHQDEQLPITHFYASLPVPYAPVLKTSTSGVAKDKEGMNDDSQTSSAKDCRYVITAYHKFSGVQNGRSTVRMVDFFLLAIGAILLPAV